MSETAPKFSARDQQLMALAWQCMDSEPKIDYKKLAELAKLTEGSAKTMMGTLRRKLREQAADVTSTAPSTPKKKASTATTTPKSKKRNAASGLDGPNELNGDESPTKKARTPKSAKAKGKKSAMNSDDDDDEFANITIKNSEVEHVKQEFHDMLLMEDHL